MLSEIQKGAPVLVKNATNGLNKLRLNKQRQRKQQMKLLKIKFMDWA